MKLFFKKKSDIPRRRLADDGDDSNQKVSSIFMRNRTLSGYLSGGRNIVDPNVDSPRTNVHHLAIKRRKIFAIFLFAVLAIVFLWFLISNFTAGVSIVASNVTISKSIDESKYSKVIQDYLNANPLGRFNFFLDSSSLNDYVSNKLPEVELITESGMASIGDTRFSIKMRRPVAGWKIDGKQYFVDNKGVPFESNYYNDSIIQITDNSGATLQTGAASVSKRFLSFVGLVVSLSSSSGYTVSQASLPLNTTRELDVTIKDINLLVKLSIDRPAGEQVEDMSRAIQYFVKQNRMPTYIDVRVSGKAFFK